MSGSFVADAACPATQAIKNGKNPGNVSTDAGKSYQLLAGNKDAPTHYLILVPGADPERRWVKVSCGHVSGSSAATVPAAGMVMTQARRIRRATPQRTPLGPRAEPTPMMALEMTCVVETGIPS